MMFRSAAPALSARAMPCLASDAPERATSTASVVSCCTLPTTSPISLAASTERSASFLTSSATTAKPRPASPARAASMAAFKARRFVWSAISSITSRILPISCERLPRPLMTRAVFSMFSEIARMPSTVRATASPPVFASSDARALMRSASEAILATSLTAPAIPETVALARDAASPRDSAFCATEAMNAAISSTVAVVSPTVPARLSRSRAIWSMDTVICSMVAEASVTVWARVPPERATCSMDAPISVMELEVSST